MSPPLPGLRSREAIQRRRSRPCVRGITNLTKSGVPFSKTQRIDTWGQRRLIDVPTEGTQRNGKEKEKGRICRYMGRTRDQKRVAENIILVCSGRLFSKCFALKFGNNDDCTFLNSSVIFLIFIFPSVSNF